MKMLPLISIIFCFIFASESTAKNEIIFTEKSKVEIYSAYF